MATTGNRSSKGSNNKKKTVTKRSNSKNGKKGSSKIDTNNNGLKDEVVLLSLMAFSILLVLSNFHLVGAFGEVVSSILFGLFGLLAYIAPVLLFVSACLVIANRGNRIAAVKVASSVTLFFLLCTFAQALGVKDNGLFRPLDWYNFAVEEKRGGGFFGGILSFLLHKAVGAVGTYIVLIVLAIICVVLITEKSFLKGVKKSGEVVYHSAKEDVNRRKEIRREAEIVRRQEKEDLENERRMNKKVTGVAVDTMIPKENKDFSEEMREVTWKDAHAIAVTDPAEEEDFDFESINIKMADSFAEDAKIESEYILPKPMEHPEYFDEVVLTAPMEESKPDSVRPDTNKKDADTTDIPEAVIKAPINGQSSEYVFPPLRLLKKGVSDSNRESQKELKETAAKLKQTLDTFGVKVTITEISQGPSVTRYEMQPEMGVKVSKIVNLADDIKLNLAATDIRIEAPIPGKAAIGIEVPNRENSAVMFRDLIETDTFTKFPSSIAFAAGKDISGSVVVADIGKMPHVLIAGATGSGKSVCINTIIMSILYKAHPDDVKMIMIDPKVVELSVYNGIPHLMIPVVTDPKKAAAALHWGVAEMTDRYKKFADFNVRDLKGYNKKVEEKNKEPGEEPLNKLPQVVIIVDELADLMMVAPGEVEESICRLAQLARAAGIHLIIATQRPSVDVITGLIKANMPSRIAFSVSSGVDSRTILDMNGAEKLLGKGDMLFYPQGYAKPARVQGAFVSDKEVQDVVDFLTKHGQGSGYSAEVEEKIENAKSGSTAASSAEEKDPYFVEAARFIIDKDKASIGMLQRVFKIGFNRAARIMDQLSEAGVVGEEEGTKPRKVLMNDTQFDEYIEEYL